MPSHVFCRPQQRQAFPMSQTISTGGSRRIGVVLIIIILVALFAWLAVPGLSMCCNA